MRRRFEAALSFYPLSANMLALNALMEEAHGSVQRAEETFKRALDERPDAGNVWREYAVMVMVGLLMSCACVCLSWCVCARARDHTRV